MGLTLDGLTPADADRPFLITDTNRLSFCEVRERVLPRARQLTGLGRRPLLIPAHLELDAILWMLAAIWAGAPLLPLHPRLSVAEQARARQQLAVLSPVEPAKLADAPERALQPIEDEHPLAFVQTSGTTSSAKWVNLSRRAFTASAEASAHHLGWQPNDRWLLNLPLAHVGGLSILTRCWLARRSIVLGSPETVRDPSALLRTLEQQRVTLLSLVPVQLERLLPRQAPAALRAVLVGGSAAAPELLQSAALQRWPVLATYGLTEACSQVATAPYPPTPDAPVGAARPLRGAQIRSIDGRLEVAGPTLFSGYLGIPGSSLTPDGYFPTGDLGQIDDGGWLRVTGRADDLIVTGGENVSPEAVEAVLRRQPGVRDAVVFGVPDPTWGQLVAAAVVADGREPTELAAALRAELAPHARPRRLAIVRRLPRGRLGKLSRQQVAAECHNALVPC